MIYQSSYAATLVHLTKIDTAPSHIINSSRLQAGSYSIFTTPISSLNHGQTYQAFVLVPFTLIPAVDDIRELLHLPAEVIGTLVVHPKGAAMEWQLDVTTITFGVCRPLSDLFGVFTVFLHHPEDLSNREWVDCSEVWVASRPDKPSELIW